MGKPGQHTGGDKSQAMTIGARLTRVESQVQYEEFIFLSNVNLTVVGVNGRKI